MAKILKTEEQENALKEIGLHIKNLRKLKDFTDVAEGDFRMAVAAKGAIGDNIRFSFTPGDDVVNEFLKNHRKKLIRRIVKLGSEFRVKFDEDEKTLLNQE